MWLTAEASKAARSLFTWMARFVALSPIAPATATAKTVSPISSKNSFRIAISSHLRGRISQSSRLGVISCRMRCGGNHPARHHATFRGGVVILLRDEPRLIRPPRQEYLLAGAFFRPRHDACDRLLDLDIIDEAEAALEQARGNAWIWKVEFGGVSLFHRYGRAILLCGDLVSRQANEHGQDTVDFFGRAGT